MTPLRRDRPGPFIGRARHHNSECRGLTARLVGGVNDTSKAGWTRAPYRAGPSPLAHAAEDASKQQAKKHGGAYSGIPHPYLRRWATVIHGYLGVPGSRMPVQPPDTRTSGSLPRARPRFDKSASRTACETTCESYITLNPRVNMRHAHSCSCIMAA